MTKGAPQVVLSLCTSTTRGLPGRHRRRQLAAGGYRTLGVARRDGESQWRFLGLLPLADPPRADSAETIRQAKEHGIDGQDADGRQRGDRRRDRRAGRAGRNIVAGL